MKNRAFFVDPQEVLAKKPKPKKRVYAGSRTGDKVYDCSVCGLDKGCRSPRMEPYGKGSLGFMIVGEAPGRDEDEEGRPFVGQAGQVLRDGFGSLGLDIDDVAKTTNVLTCRPKDNRWPGDEKARCCLPRLKKQIAEYEPNVIFALGEKAIKAVLDPPFKVAVTAMRGRMIPLEYALGKKCWVCCCFHPSYVMRMNRKTQEEEIDPVLSELFTRDLVVGLEHLDLDVNKERGFWDSNNYILVRDFDIAVSAIRLLVGGEEVNFDFETNCYSPWQKDVRVLTVAFKKVFSDDLPICIPFDHPESSWNDKQMLQIQFEICEWLRSDTPKSGQTERFEDIWSRIYFGAPVQNYIWDTDLGAHVIDNRGKTTNLEFQAFCEFGTRHKEKINRAKMASYSLEEIARYSCGDVVAQALLRKSQAEKMVGGLEKAHGFFRQCARTLINFEERGLKIDRRELDKFDIEVSSSLSEIGKVLGRSEFVGRLERDQGAEVNWDSPLQVSKLIYGKKYAGVAPITEPGRSGIYSTGDDVLSLLTADKGTSEEVKKLLRAISEYRKFSHLKSTYVEGFRSRMYRDDIIHPCFLLSVADTYRSCSLDPNAQNIPVRDPITRGFRRCIVPRNDVLVEFDFAGAEVRVIAMISGDGVLIDEILRGVDTHDKWAKRLFGIEDSKKDHRYLTKNQFVFPEFYGSWYSPISQNLGLDPEHVKEVEREFWDTYSRAAEWERELEQFYKKNLYLETPLGFRFLAPMRKNKWANSIVQGTAFHLCLESCRSADKKMIEKKMRSFCVIEVHDAILADVVLDELEGVIEIVSRAMTKKKFEFEGIVPMVVGVKTGLNWMEMEELNV